MTTAFAPGAAQGICESGFMKTEVTPLDGCMRIAGKSSRRMTLDGRLTASFQGSLDLNLAGDQPRGSKEV